MLQGNILSLRHTHTNFLKHTTPLQEDSMPMGAYDFNINKSPTNQLNKKVVKNLAL